MASSTPATSLNVTFFCWLDSSRARLLPKESALLPPVCIWRMKKIHSPKSKSMGSPFTTQLITEPLELSLIVTLTFFSVSDL